MRSLIMFADVNHPETLSPDELDAYLARGWFRMGPTIFTTNFLSFKEQLYGAIWLRVVLGTFEGEKTQSRLFRLNSGFKTEIANATITPEKEALFATYKKSVAFEASASLQHLLFGKAAHAAYQTLEVTVRDNDKLIAAGYFDLGSTSGMGISSFYDPDYKKHSLGKYLIYLKMQYCKNLKLQYFYPGYFVPGYPFFDYKLTLAKKSLYYLQLETGEWNHIQKFLKSQSPLQVMQDQLLSLNEELSQQGIPSRLMRYEFFDANLIPDLAGAGLFDFPLFLFLPGSLQEAINLFVIFDVIEKQFQLVRCRGIWKTNSTTSSESIYSAYVLKLDEVINVSSSSTRLALAIAAERNTLIPRTGTV